MAKLAFLSVVIVSFLSAGCASNQQSKKLISLQAQVNVIADELVRLDMGLQDMRSAIQSESNRIALLESKKTKPAQSQSDSRSPVYRTPSGFSLQAVDIQKALKGAGYYQGSVDGKIGPETRNSVKAFQRDHGLKVDGVVGQGTWGKLKAYLPGRVK